MKKYLALSTAAMVAIMSHGNVADAATSSPSLKISGQLSTNFYAFGQTSREENGGRGNGHHLAVEDSGFNFSVFGKADGYRALEYLFFARLSADTNETKSFQEVYAQFKNDMGTLRVGDTRGVDDFMATGAFTVMGATGGFAGNYANAVNPTYSAIYKLDLGGTAAKKEATTMTYVTPRVNGFQAGVSFTPNAEHRGEGKVSNNTSIVNTKKSFDVNQSAYGVNYMNTFANGVDVKVSATGLFGQTKGGRGNTLSFVRKDGTVGTSSAAHKTKAYALGGLLGYKGWQFGAEFMDNDKSQMPTAALGSDAGKLYSGALGYTIGNDTFTGGYLHGTRKVGAGFRKTKTNVYSVTWDKKLAPGLSVYAEGNLFDMKTDRAYITAVKANAAALIDNGTAANVVGNNRGHVVIVGSKIKF